MVQLGKKASAKNRSKANRYICLVEKEYSPRVFTCILKIYQFILVYFAILKRPRGFSFWFNFSAIIFIPLG